MTMATTPQPSPAAGTRAGAAPAKTPHIEIFFTPRGFEGLPVSLWITHKTQERSPDVDGTIGETRVAGYFQSGPRGGFLSFVDSKAGKGAAGNYRPVGAGNVVVNAAGIPKLALKLTGGALVWVKCSRKAPVELLVRAGLNLEIQAAKKAERALRMAASAPHGEAEVAHA